MAITELTDDLDIIAALDDEPNDVGGLTASQLKAKFDEGPNDIKDYLNDTHIPELDADHLPYIYGSANTIKDTMEGIVAGVVPDDSVTSAMLKSNSVTTDKISDGSVTYAKLDSTAVALMQKNLINILRLKLQVSLGASDIDAWSDLFADSSNIDTANSSYYQVSGGSLSVFALQQLNEGTALDFGYSTSNNAYIGQTFTAPTWGMTLSSAKVKLKKEGSPADNVSAYIYATSGGAPTGSELYTSTNSISGSALTTDYSECTFTFSGATLAADTVYALVLRRSGSLDTLNYYYASINTSNPYSGGCAYGYESSSWVIETSCDFYFDFTISDTATVICDAVTPTEALTYAAICTEQNAGTGTIVWYLSDDGTNWTEITNLDAIQTMNFDEVTLYLKCVLTGNATVSAVAYGGY